jgi:hypothetical protein
VDAQEIQQRRLPSAIRSRQDGQSIVELKVYFSKLPPIANVERLEHLVTLLGSASIDRA